MAATNLDPILWVGNVSQIRLPQFFPFQKNEVEIVLRASVEEALYLLKRQKFSVILAQDLDENESLEFLVQARLYQPLAPRIMISEDLTEADVREGINQAQVFRFMRWPLSEREIWAHLESALEKHSSFMSRSLLMRESAHQNKQLEALTNSLEGMVEERTQYIEISHKEESDKLNRERQLLRFIKDLSSQTSFEEILGILRKELRKFHKMGDPILVYRLGPSKTIFMNFHMGYFAQSEAAAYYPFPASAETPEAELIRYFANHFGRPFIKAYVTPLELRLTSHFVGGHVEALICVENSLNDKEIGPFMEFMQDRLGPMSMALDRVLLENQLSMFSYRWEKTFDGMRDPIAIMDLDYEVVRANRKFSDKFIQKKCYQSFAGKDAPCEGCPIGEAFENGVTTSGQIEVDGRIYLVHSYPVLHGQGSRPTNVVNQYVDITQSRELYLRMLQSEKMGAIGLLAGNIAHELNNPLTGLRSLTQVLLQEVEDGTNLYADLIEIEKATGRSQRIIKNLLDFSKGEDQPAEVVSVNSVVDRTLPMLKSALRIHRLSVELDENLPSVFIEPHLLQQVLFNLINNSCQAMKNPGTVSIQSYLKDGWITLAVEDTGPGIPAEVKKRVFDPFFTTKKEGQGTGLGLSMSKSVIEKFGGHIEILDVEPQGCRFEIRLPQMKGN